jgi:hypothetical protein
MPYSYDMSQSEEFKKDARDRQRVNSLSIERKLGKGEATEIAADIVGTSRASVTRAGKVKELDADLYEQMRRGEISGNAAYEKATGKQTRARCNDTKKREGLCSGGFSIPLAFSRFDLYAES